MAEKTIGKLTSDPDADGDHKLKCPRCKSLFKAPVTRDELTGDTTDVTCPNCGHADKGLLFLYELQKQTAEKITRDYADKLVRDSLKKFKL